MIAVMCLKNQLNTLTFDKNVQICNSVVPCINLASVIETVTNNSNIDNLFITILDQYLHAA